MTRHPITYTTKLDMVVGMIRSKMTWIETFSAGRSKRPDHEIEHKREEVAVLNEIAADYRKAVDVEVARSRA